jgi:type IV secretion system protein VirB3
MATNGYRIKLHSSLVSPIMLMGVPRRFAILNWTICAALILGLHILYILPVSIMIHICAVFFAKRDPYFFDVLMRHLQQKRYYE